MNKERRKKFVIILRLTTLFQIKEIILVKQ